MMRLPRVDYLGIIILLLQGDYFFDPVIALTMAIIKEISDITAMKLDIIRDMVSYVVISHHLLSFVKVGGNHTLLSNYLL